MNIFNKLKNVLFCYIKREIFLYYCILLILSNIIPCCFSSSISELFGGKSGDRLGLFGVAQGSQIFLLAQS